MAKMIERMVEAPVPAGPRFRDVASIVRAIEEIEAQLFRGEGDPHMALARVAALKAMADLWARRDPNSAFGMAQQLIRK